MISIVLFIVMVGFAHPISMLMQAPEEAVALTASYVRIRGSGIFFIVAYNLLSAIFRGLGDSKSPLLFVLVACIVNVIGDLVLVAGLPYGCSRSSYCHGFCSGLKCCICSSSVDKEEASVYHYKKKISG